MTKTGALASAGLLILLGVACFSYWPGLAGPFIFDDFATLPRLARYGDIDSLAKALVYLAGDISGTRPIALLTFIANSPTWPADPWPFKATNLFLHLLTGGMLYLFCRQLLDLHGLAPAKAVAAAAFAAAFWLLNPFNVSTVLYVVQRMAMLSAFFILSGLVVYLHGRRLLPGRPRAAYLWMSAAIALFTPLAVLSKENGALLPFLVLVLESTLPRQSVAVGRLSRAWAGIFIWLPSFALLALIAYHAGPQGYVGRNFNLVERLLTEARVLVDYLWHWFNPYVAPRGVLADDYPVVRSLFRPWTTLPAVAGIVALLAWGLWQRQRHPLAALAILFYFAGHVMESTVLPLEIYFEHRNYLPAMLLALPLAHWAATRITDPRLALAAAGLALLALGSQTHRLAGIWGNDLALAKWSSLTSPDSLRAIGNLATAVSRYGRPDLAIGVLQDGIRRHPEYSHLQFQLMAEKCVSGGLAPGDWDAFNRYFGQYPMRSRSFPLLAALVSTVDSPQCPGLDNGRLLNLIRLIGEHPEIQHDADLRRLLRHSEGELLVRRGEPEAALAAFTECIRLRPSVGVGLQEVVLLASHGDYAEALTLLQRVEAIPEPAGIKEAAIHRFYANGIPQLRQTLLHDLAAQRAETARR